MYVLESRSNEGNKHQNNTWVSAWTVRHESTYIILLLTRHNEPIKIHDKEGDLNTPSPCLNHSIYILLMTAQSIANDVTKIRQLWNERVISDI